MRIKKIKTLGQVCIQKKTRLVIDWTGTTSALDLFGPLHPSWNDITGMKIRVCPYLWFCHVPAPARCIKRSLSSAFRYTTPTSIPEQRSPWFPTFTHHFPHLDRDSQFHHLLPRLQTTDTPHNNRTPEWTPRSALTSSCSMKCTYARHGGLRTSLSPPSGILTAPCLLRSTRSAAGRASPSSSLKGMTVGTAAFTSIATKADLDEALRSPRWTRQFVTRSDTTSPRDPSHDTRVYCSIAFEADKSLGRQCGARTTGAASTRAILRRYSATVTSLLYWCFPSHYSSPPTSMSPSQQHA